MLERIKQPGSTRKVTITFLVLPVFFIVTNVLPIFKSGPCTPNFDLLLGVIWLLFTVFYFCGACLILE